MLWTRQPGGSKYDYGFGIAVDGAGNSYVTGAFQGTATFGGTNLTSNGVSGDPPGTYSPATIVKLAAEPDIGWLFLGWGGDASGTTTTNLSLVMNRDQTVIAYFQSIALMATTSGGGSIQGNAQPLYPKGTIVVLTALPDPGWQFLGWMGDAQDTNATLSVTMNGPLEVQAGFGTSLKVTNAGSGMIIRSSALDPISWGGALNLTAVPEAGYFFALWGNAARGTINPLDFIVTNANPTVAALFLPLETNQVTLTALVDGFGYIVQLPAANVYTNGQTVTLIATPVSGQQFLDWSGALSGSQNPTSLTLDGSRTVTARFTRHLALSAKATLLWNGSTGVRVTVAGEIGTNYEVQSSTDWTKWPVFKVLSLFPGEAQFIDSTATNAPSRFLRAIQLP